VGIASCCYAQLIEVQGIVNNSVTELPDEAAVERFSLLETSSEAGTSRTPTRGELIRIGRATDNDVVLSSEPTVSRYHAEVSFAEGGWTIRDVGSHNGTHINGKRLAEHACQSFGSTDIVTLGAVTVRLIEVDEADGLTVADGRGSELHQLLTALSAREREVLTLVAQGKTDDQVAAELYISVKTVHSHLDRIRDKTSPGWQFAWGWQPNPARCFDSPSRLTAPIPSSQLPTVMSRWPRYWVVRRLLNPRA
jgi:DNA-binding CsgD family transcriptional regulator